MTDTHTKLNRGTKTGADKAATHLPALTRAYGRTLRAAGRRAASRLRTTEPIMAAANEPPNWTPPPAGQLINQQELASDTKRKTAKLHKQMLTASASSALQPFDISFDIRAPTSQAILDAIAARIQGTITSAIEEQITEAIQNGYAEGYSVDRVARDIISATDRISRVRADMLARTDLNALSNAGSLLGTTAADAAQTKTWLCIVGDTRVQGLPKRVARRLHFGELVTFRCRPSGWLSDTGPLDSDLTVTANHPVLTGRGWIQAKLIEPGDRVFGCPSLDFSMGQDPNVETVPPTIAEVFDAATDRCASERIVGRVVNFDGEWERGEVEVVAVDGALRRRFDAELLEPETQSLFAFSDVGLGETLAESATLNMLVGERDTDSLELALSVGGQRGGIVESPSLDTSRGLTANGDASDVEYTPKWGVGNAEAVRERAQRLSGLVSAHDVIDVEVNPWSGYVYDLETESGWFLANGIIVHNSTDDERTRETHADADGQTVGINDAFDVGGEAAQYPGDPDLSWEESANCRCTLIYGEPLIASAAIAQWRDHLWEGSELTLVVTPHADAVTSGGNMARTKTEDAMPVVAQAIHGGRRTPADEVFAATGDTSLPLSERDRAWDSGEATGRVKKWASSDGSGDPDKIDYGKLAGAYFWRDTASGDPKIGDFKLPFADIIGGKLTAVWRGVTAGAARLSQTQGVDKAAVQKKMGVYYTAAAKKYGDDSIKPPWASGSASVDGERLAAVRAHLADYGADVLDDDELRATILTFEALSRSAGGKGLLHATLEMSDVTLLAAAEGDTPWTATLCVAGTPTVDSGIKRLLAADGGSWLPLPLPLAIMDDSPHADMVTSSPLCGRIDSISVAGDVYQASGVFFDASDDPEVAAAGSRAAAIVDEMRRMGISVDLVDCDVDMMVYNGVSVVGLDDVMPMDSASDPIGDVDNLPGGPATESDVDAEPDGDIDDLEYVMVFNKWVIAGATICPVQALTQATISLVAAAFSRETEWRSETEFALPALTAAAAGLVPVEPPGEWFADPVLDGPTPLTVTDEGRVFGHMATWDTCHTGFPGCVPPPRSPTGYMNFHLGEIKTAEGERVSVGTLAFDMGHAGPRASVHAARNHYMADTRGAGAHVRAGEDEWGIWLAGALNPRISAEDARTLMASAPSGDWRQVRQGEGRDLVGVLAVNEPGFPVRRERKGLSLQASACGPCDEALARELAVLAASVDGIEGLAELVA